MSQQNKTLYLECSSGISGDMTVAALLDLGASEEVLREVLATVPAHGFEIKISRVKKAGLDVCDFDVILDAEHENHDHDMEYLHGHEHHYTHGQEETHEHHHAHGQEEAHEHHHTHGQEEPHEHHHAHGQEEAHEHHHTHGQEEPHEHHHAHEHRGLPEVLQVIDQTKMTDNARKIAKDIFQILAQAEAKAHGVPLTEVHFHEVGAIDSIVDIISVAVCLDNLQITDCVVPVIHEGMGSIRCQHGLLPVPVPAVANIAAAHHLKLEIEQVNGELVTPTGAAIVAAVKTSDELPKTFSIQKIGMGAGKRNYERPGILRAMLIEA